MLVDLARNDVNRVCQPKTVKLDQLMEVEKFSHVIHLTSQVSGMLRKGLTRYLLSLPHLYKKLTQIVVVDLMPSALFSQLELFRVHLRSKRLSSFQVWKRSAVVFMQVL
jgi:hypothetical protein